MTTTVIISHDGPNTHQVKVEAVCLGSRSTSEYILSEGDFVRETLYKDKQIFISEVIEEDING